jgi:hypothetical protein
MTGRCECETHKVEVPGCPPIYLHTDRWKHAAPTFWVSSPPKFKDSAVGQLLEELMNHINKELA